MTEVEKLRAEIRRLREDLAASSRDAERFMAQADALRRDLYRSAERAA